MAKQVDAPPSRAIECRPCHRSTVPMCALSRAEHRLKRVSWPWGRHERLSDQETAHAHGFQLPQLAYVTEPGLRDHGHVRRDPADEALGDVRRGDEASQVAVVDAD